MRIFLSLLAGYLITRGFNHGWPPNHFDWPLVVAGLAAYFATWPYQKSAAK